MLRGTQSGFAYVILLIALAIIGVSSAAAIHASASMSRRSAEEQLMIIGNEFEKALLTYSSGAPDAGPAELSELLKDQRVPGLQRHLRRIYEDPLSGSNMWGLRRDPAGRITGVYSLAPGVPIRRTGFDSDRTSFEGAVSYRQWVFGLQLQDVWTPPP
jgi:type II secretory pathway pseudopilin PulG